MATAPEERLFADNPVRLRLFRAVRALIEGLGDVQVEATKSQVSFGMDRKFAWVWLPPEWDRRRPDDCIVLSFSLRREVGAVQARFLPRSRPPRRDHGRFDPCPSRLV